MYLQLAWNSECWMKSRTQLLLLGEPSIPMSHCPVLSPGPNNHTFMFSLYSVLLWTFLIIVRPFGSDSHIDTAFLVSLCATVCQSHVPAQGCVIFQCVMSCLYPDWEPWGSSLLLVLLPSLTGFSQPQLWYFRLILHRVTKVYLASWQHPTVLSLEPEKEGGMAVGPDWVFSVGRGRLRTVAVGLCRVLSPAACRA